MKKVLIVLLVIMVCAGIIGIIYSNKRPNNFNKPEDYLIYEYVSAENDKISIGVDYNNNILYLKVSTYNPTDETTTTKENTTTLTETEKSKIKLISDVLGDENAKQLLIEAVYLLVKGNEPLTTKEENEHTWALYEEYDLNNDEIVTSAEMGDGYLDKMISEYVDSNKDEEYLYKNFNDEGIPGSNYDVKLNRETKSLYVKEINYSSAVDVPITKTEHTITLTEEELNKINKIIEYLKDKEDIDKVSFVNALAALVKDEEVMYSKEENETMWENRKEYDTDGDEVVQYREFGNHFLNSIMEEYGI